MPCSYSGATRGALYTFHQQAVLLKKVVCCLFSLRGDLELQLSMRAGGRLVCVAQPKVQRCRQQLMPNGDDGANVELDSNRCVGTRIDADLREVE
mmetsp:Transcript_15686/g.35573  ORF Transcript_15686/g.35573 Transcript_15686/m.35573 type:complete len:95 (-) Transcript_15686:1407-1691(-)